MNIIIFISHKVNKFSLEQYDYIKKTINDKCDILFCTSDDVSYLKINNIKYVQYDNNIVVKDNFYDVFNVVEYAYNYILNYDYIYCIEYDVYCNNWKTLFNDLENDNSDLLCAYIKKFTFGEYTPWMWTNQYFNAHNINDIDLSINFYLKSCLSFFKISFNAIKCIKEYTKSDLRNYIYEMYVPTILYNNGFSIKSLSSNEYEDDLEFHKYTYILPQYYYVGKYFNNKNEMNVISNGKCMLFTTYKNEINK